MQKRTLSSLVVAMAFLGCAEKGKPVNDKPKSISRAAPQKVTATPAKTAKSTATPTSQPTARPTSQPTSAPAKAAKKRLPPGHPPTPSVHNAQSAPTSAPAALAKAATGIIKGRIEISESLRSRVKGGATLFIMVRRYAGEGKKGMIMAAKKVPVGGASLFPLDFTVSQRDVMMGGTKLVGPVSVAARIDQDGDAISKQPGDIEGSHKGMVQVGKDRASITLDVLRQ